MTKAEEEIFKIICNIMLYAIQNTYRSFGVNVSVKKLKVVENYLVFQIAPGAGVRVKTVMSYEKDIALQLGMDVKLKLMATDGCIGVMAPILQFTDKMKRMVKDDIYKPLYKSIDGIEDAFQNSNKKLVEKPEELDDLFEKAGRLIITRDKASIGMLQRALQIGFNRAARIMDQLCQYGVVGEEEGMKPRKILMNREQFEGLLKKLK